LCSVACADLAVDISSVEVVPFLLVLSLPQEHAEMVQLLLLSESPNFIFGSSNLLNEQSESSFIFLTVKSSSNGTTEYPLFRQIILISMNYPNKVLSLKASAPLAFSKSPRSLLLSNFSFSLPLISTKI